MTLTWILGTLFAALFLVAWLAVMSLPGIGIVYLVSWLETLPQHKAQFAASYRQSWVYCHCAYAIFLGTWVRPSSDRCFLHGAWPGPTAGNGLYLSRLGDSNCCAQHSRQEA